MHLHVLQYAVPMTSSVQSHLPSSGACTSGSALCKSTSSSKTWGSSPGARGQAGATRARAPIDVSALSVEASAHAVLSVEASAHDPGWDVGAASGAATRSANHAHCFAEAIVTRAEGSHRRHVRTKSHSAPDSGSGLLGAGFAAAAQLLPGWPRDYSGAPGPCVGHAPMMSATARAIAAPFPARRARVSPDSAS